MQDLIVFIIVIGAVYWAFWPTDDDCGCSDCNCYQKKPKK